MIFVLFCLLLPYMAFVAVCAIVLFAKLGKTAAPAKQNNNYIPICVIVPVRNEEENLPLLISSLTSQSYKNFSIIIIDDDSDDATWQLLQQYAAQYDIITAVKATGRGKKQAVKQAVSLTDAELIVCTDADCTAQPEWLQCMADAYYDNFADMLIAPVKLSGKHYMQSIEFLSLQAVTAATALLEIPTMCNGANIGFAKSTYEECSDNLNFRLASGDDMFLLSAIKQKHGKICYVNNKKAIVETKPQKKLKDFLQQRARWVSKSPAYTDNAVIAVAVIVFLTQILLILSACLAFFDINCLRIWVAKFLVDFLLFIPAAFFFEQKKLLLLALPAGIIYPFYVLFTAGYSLSGNIKWKKRRI